MRPPARPRPPRTYPNAAARHRAEQMDLFGTLLPTAPVLVAAPTPAPDGTRRAPRATVKLPADIRASWPLVLSYGMGVDSTAILVLLKRSGIRPDLILFADTGGEHPETYAYLPVIQDWLRQNGFPPVTVVQYQPETAEYDTLEGNCRAKGMLPSLAYGGHMHGCSLKFKVGPLDRTVNRWPKAVEVWKLGGKVVRIIGYDDSPADQERQERFASRGGTESTAKYRYWYPLQDAGWDRRTCLTEIAREGLPEPPKSSCFFCPSKKPAELISLVIEQPDLAYRIVEMELRAGPNLKAIDGLWGTGTKGTDGGVAKPGSMSEFMLRWMLDGRAYERFPKTEDRGLVGREARRLPHVGRIYLPVVQGGDPDEYGPTDPAAVAALAAQGRAAAARLYARVEREHGVGSVERMIAAGHVRAARRARLARARTLAGRIADKHKTLAGMGPRPALVEGDPEAARRSGKRKDPEARARVVARNAWDRFFEGLRKDEAEFQPLFAEFGHDLIYRPDKDETEAMMG